ncbi:hypothetical protein [Bacillus pumilus]
MSKRRECIENYKITTVVTPEVKEFFKDVMGSKEFYDFASNLMYKYKKA